MIIKKKKKINIEPEEQELQQVIDNVEQETISEQPAQEEEIDLFNLDNIDFKQRNERRKGDRRRGFRRTDDRNLISRAREEANAIKEASAQEGYQAGLEMAKSDIQGLREALASFYNAKQVVYDSIAGDVLEIGMDIAKKIIKKETIDHPEIILENIKDILYGLSKDEAKITIEANPSQIPLLKQELPEVTSSFGLEAKIVMVPDENILEGGCRITTTNGVIDATIESQLSIISEVLREI